MDLNLKGKRVLVTGGSRGIGASICKAFAAMGADVIVNFAANHEAAEKVVQAITREGVKAMKIQADVSDYKQVRKMFKKIISEFGGLDVLVNNAGITRDKLLLKMNSEDWEKVIATNLTSVYNCCREAAKIFVKQRSGKIINISSVVGLHGNTGQANYSASKAGIIGFSKSLAKELASRNVAVNVIAPGFIETDMTDDLPEKAKATLFKQIPLGRPGKPEEVAHLAVFLASNRADYITGQVISIDGGMFM